jgi:glycosyltransferase involved in cell wall biosynthesis
VSSFHQFQTDRVNKVSEELLNLKSLYETRSGALSDHLARVESDYSSQFDILVGTIGKINSISRTPKNPFVNRNKKNKSVAKKLLSVVVTSYNYKHYIGATLMSLVNQSFKDFEIIVVDDGSTDGSVDFIKEFIVEYPDIKFYQHQDGINKGLPASTRLGIEKATGKYVAFCESDDYWEENHVEHIVKYIGLHPEAELLFNRINVVNKSSLKDTYESYVLETHDFLMRNNIKNIFLSLSRNYMPTLSAACIRRDLLLACDFNSYHPQYIDFWLWRQLCLMHSIHFVSDAVTYWRKHDESYDMKQNISDISDFLMANNQLLMQRISMPWYRRFEILKLYRLNKPNNEIIESEMKDIYKLVDLKRKLGVV